MNRAAPPERPNNRETAIQALSFSGRMIEGVPGNNDINAEIPFLKLGGKGGLTLVERTLPAQLPPRRHR